MNNPIQIIEGLIPSLPERDIVLGHKFLKTRDFESLKMLVDSAIIKVKKGLMKENPKEEYLKVNMERLQTLKAEVDTYYSMLELPEQEEDDIYEEFNEEFNEEYY